MSIQPLSISFRNCLGNILQGVILIALGVMRLTNANSLAHVALLLILIVITVTSFLTNFSSKREHDDEMSSFHSGRAANLALWTTLIAVSCANAVGICTEASIDLASACYLITGFALFSYGIGFAMLERGM